MQIPIEVTNAMFAHAKVDRIDLHAALRQMAGHFLKSPYKDQWSDVNPTRFFDYIVTEWLFHFKAPPGSFPFRVELPFQEAKHYFMRWPDGTIVDLTAEQFSQWELVDYAKAKKASLPNGPTHRARVLNTLMFAVFLA